MAQLRDAQTSALIAEGTPLEIAHAAEAFPKGEVIFDGMGGVDRDGVSTFDPAAVRKAHADDLAGLHGALGELPVKPPKGASPEQHKQQRDGIIAAIDERRDLAASGRAMQTGAKDALANARDRVERRKAEDRARR